MFFSKHARMTVDVAKVFLSLLSLEVRRFIVKAFLKFGYGFWGGGGDSVCTSTWQSGGALGYRLGHDVTGGGVRLAATFIFPMITFTHGSGSS